MKRHLFLPIFTVVTLAFSLSPWFIGLLATPADRVFGGVNRWSADYYTYVSFVETGVRGQLKEYHLTTTKAQDPIWIHGVYTLSGYLGRLGGFGNSVLIYHLDRLIFGTIFILCLSGLYYRAFGRLLWVAVALVFVFWIGGFPKTLDIWGRWDARYLYVIQEMNIVGRATSPPHYLLSFSLFVLGIWFFMTNRAFWLKKSVVLVFLVIGMTIANPVNLLTFLLTIGVFGVFRGVGGFWMNRLGRSLRSPKKLAATFFLGIGSLPIAWYYQQKLSIFPWGPRSNALKFYIPGQSINEWELVLALGPVVVLAVIGLVGWGLGWIREIGERRKIRGIDYQWGLVFFSWFVVQFGFIAVSGRWGIDPLRFLQGLYYIPLAYFGVRGIRGIGGIREIRWGEKRLKMWVGGIVVVCFVITLPTLVLSYREQLYMNTDYKRFETLIYPTKYQYQGYKFLEKNTPFGSGVLAYYEVTEVLPAFSGNSTERDLSHGDKTPFFTNQLRADKALQFLKTNRFAYVWVGYQEGSAGFRAQDYPFLTKIFENREVRIYKLASSQNLTN